MGIDSIIYKFEQVLAEIEKLENNEEYTGGMPISLAALQSKIELVIGALMLHECDRWCGH